MTAQEQQMLHNLTGRINGTTLTEKDSAAEQFLSQSLGPNPDATYIMAQTLLVQGYALEQAQKQLAEARQQLAEAQQQTAAPKHEGSFLGNLLHLNDSPARSAAPPPPPQAGQYAPVQTYAQQQQYGQPQYAMPPGQAPATGNSFLGSAMRTATGVAAGALAFEGIESLMHGFGGGGMGGGFGMGGFGAMGSGREEIVNNFYGGDSGREDQIGGRDLGSDAGSGFGDRLSADVEDRRDDARGFADTGSANDRADDTFSSGDDSSGDDSSFDSGGSDDSSFDSGSSDDSSS